jgi:hypothetical protein
MLALLYIAANPALIGGFFMGSINPTFWEFRKKF